MKRFIPHLLVGLLAIAFLRNPDLAMSIGIWIASTIIAPIIAALSHIIIAILNFLLPTPTP